MAAPANELAEARDLVTMLAERASSEKWQAVLVTLRAHMFHLRHQELIRLGKEGA